MKAGQFLTKQVSKVYKGKINMNKNDEYKTQREASKKDKVWTWKDYDDLSGHLVAPDGKSYFSYDWTTKEYKVTPDSVWDSFLDADPTRDTSLTAFKEYAQKFVKENIVKDRDIKIIFEREYIDTEKLLEDFQDRFNESGQMLAELEAEKEFVPSEYVLSKLKEKGIEVVTEKEEFERILQRESHLQKMAGSLSFEEQKRYFTFDEDDSQKFHAQIDEWQKDNINIAKLVTVGKIPPVMKILNIDDNPIEIQYSTLNKIVRDNPLYPNDEQGHKLSIDDIYAIPSQLADPVMVFKSRTRADSFVFFTERKDRENRSILIPLAVNKKKGRIIINEITSMYGRNNEIDFVKSNIDENNLIYADKKRSLDWERSSQVQFLTQRFSNPSFELSVLTKERLVNFLSSNSRKNNVQNMFSNGTTYGFTHEGKIYLNPDVLSAEVAMHEYTHLWDNLTRKDNPELWNKGLQIFKGTSLWNEVVNDENYADIKDDENLVLSECHARITGKVAEAVLNRIAEQDGTEKQAEMIDWDKETINFIFENYRDVFAKNGFETVAEFTSATMKELFSPVEQQKRDISINSSAYERMEKLFEGKMTYLGSVNGETFNELCKWVEEEFPEKDSKGVLLEATSRMIEDNLDFGEFNYQAFDDVYGFRDGAQWRFDLSDSAAKKLISGEILTLSDAQSFIWEKTEKEFAELKNNPQYKDEIEITDRINSAFRIADFLYPEITKEIDKEKNLLPDEWPQYSNEEKKNVINNAFEKIKSAFDEKKLRLSDSRTDELVFEGSDKWLLLGDFKALIKGKDAAEHGKESLSYIRPNAEQLHDGIENGWEFDEITTGYAIFQNQDLDVKDGFTPKFISKLDDMNVFESDGDAAKQYSIDHNCRILEEKKDIWIGDEDLEYYSYPDIPENRRIMKENGWLLEQPLEFDFSEFTEKDFNRIRDELFKDNPKEDYYGRLHIGSLHVEFVINQNDGWIDTNYYILGEKGEGETQFGVPYGHFPGHQFIANLFTDNTYEEFKEKVTKAILDDIAEEGTLKPEAMRPLVDWNDEQQCNELYHTKLVESARVNEIVIAPYSREERDVEAVRDFVSKIVNLPVLGVSDDMVFAVLDNIGRVQDEKPGDFLKIRKDGSVEHISALGPVEKEPVEVLHIINSFAEDHASVSEEGSQQRKDYEYINSLYEKMAEKNVTVDAPSVDSYKEMLEIIQEQMQQERNNDFAHPNAEDLEFASPKDIKEYCKLNSEIELTDEQVREIHNFYDNNDQFALYVSPAGNLYVRDEYKEELISADSELLKAGNHLRTLEGKERLEYLLKNTSNDEPEWSKGLLNQTSNDSDERLRIVSNVLSDSFATLDRHDGFWQLLLDYGADPTRAIRIAAEDANLGDNLNWLLNNVPESQLNQIFSDNGYADTVFDIAQKSVEHDMDSWHGGQDIGFEGFKRIARLCEREADADRYYGELLEKAFEKPVEPKIVQLLDTPELLEEKMNAQRIHQNEPEITKEQASAILDYCNYENIKFYCDKNGDIFSLDVSEEYNGEGLREDNFSIVANGIEYARKAKDLDYSCYSTATFNTVSELWQKEHQFANPSVEKNEIIEENTTMNDNELNQPEEVKAALVEAGIARSELYNNVESIPVSEEARNAMLSASYAGQGGITQRAFADNGIEIDLSTANALENCFSQIEAMTKYTADGHDLFHSGNGVDTISEHTIEYSEANKAWFVHEKNWLALSAIKGNEAEPEDYMEKAGRVGDKNWALSCEELVKYVYQEIKEDGEMEKEFPDTFKKLEKLNEYLEAERIKENGVQRRKENYFANIKVSTENFRDVFNEVIKLPKFKDKPLEAASWCFSKVPKENKAEVAQWFSNLGCKTKKDTDKLFNKWNRENNPKLNVNKSKNNDKDDWSISD